MTYPKHLMGLRPLLFLLLLTSIPTGHAQQNRLIPLESGNEISLRLFGEGSDRILWLPSEFGFRGAREIELAERFAGMGTEVWLADLHTSYFLAPGRSSLNQIPTADMAELIRQAQPESGRLFLLSTGRGAALALTAAREWQSRYRTDSPLGGLILFHPNLHSRPPLPGEPAQYLPITRQSNLPIFLIQPGNSAKRWYLNELITQLEQGGSDVFIRTLGNVSDGFHMRPDFTKQEARVSEQLPQLLRQAMALLNGYNRDLRSIANDEQTGTPAWDGNTFKENLQPYPGNPVTKPLQLHDLQGNRYDLETYRGQVVLLNFWATWCPPCVKEIPSLGRLQERMRHRAFTVLSVDIGEPPETVAAFLQGVPARFPVLLDPDGTTVPEWHIRAFPTSFLLDREGRIRYGYFGALEWDDDSVVALIEELL